MIVLFQAEDGIRDLVRSRGLGDVYKRQTLFSETKSRGQRTEDGRIRPRLAQRRYGRLIEQRLSLIHI